MTFRAHGLDLDDNPPTIGKLPSYHFLDGRDDGVPHPMATTSQPIYAEARRQVAVFRQTHGKVPSIRAMFNKP